MDGGDEWADERAEGGLGAQGRSPPGSEWNLHVEERKPLFGFETYLCVWPFHERNATGPLVQGQPIANLGNKEVREYVTETFPWTKTGRC
jgi:hypothetical protein